MTDKKIQKINSETIQKLAQADLEAFQKNEKSFKMWNWVKDELILCQIHGVNKLEVEPKALARMVNVLSLIRERNMEKLSINILDSKTAHVDFKFDLTTLDNRERRRLNNDYNLNLEMLTTDNVDETYSHMI